MNQELPNFNPEVPTQEHNEPIKSEKEIAWEKKLEEINNIADRLGKGIDENIKKSVAAFMIHEFTTDSSCEGHISEGEEEQHGLPYPWVQVYADEPEGWSEAEGDKKEAIEHEWRINNLEQQRKMMGFLEEFYKKRETPFDARLAFDRVGAFGGFRVQSFGADITAVLTLEEQKEKLALYRKEMDEFTKFLRDKFFV